MSLDWIPTGPTRKIRAKEQGNRGLFPSLKVPNEIIEYEATQKERMILEDAVDKNLLSRSDPILSQITARFSVKNKKYKNLKILL